MEAQSEPTGVHAQDEAVKLALEETWNIAFNQLPNTGPLGVLLRGRVPMPSSARKAVAEFLNPGHPTYELEDTWLNAFNKLPNAKPLAALLRSNTAMPPGARDLLAELLSPGSPDICGGRLVYEPTNGIKKAIDELLPAVSKYNQLVAEGVSSQKAAEDVGDEVGKTDRTVYRYLEAWRGLVRRLAGR
jgi:hypothetical protein